ncbi:MAG TPA: hypothetical protein VI968_01335 [archaeon]|nr:hypothetical protein [archaeon]
MKVKRLAKDIEFCMFYRGHSVKHFDDGFYLIERGNSGVIVELKKDTFLAWPCSVNSSGEFVFIASSPVRYSRKDGPGRYRTTAERDYPNVLAHIIDSIRIGYDRMAAVV